MIKPDYTLEFITLLYSYTGYSYTLIYCQTHMKCLFTKIQSNIAIWQYIAIHSNTIRNMALTYIVSPLLTSYLTIIYNFVTAINHSYLTFALFWLSFSSFPAHKLCNSLYSLLKRWWTNFLMAMKQIKSNGISNRTTENSDETDDKNENVFKFMTKTKTSNITSSSPFRKTFLYGWTHPWIIAMIIQAVCR